MIEIKNLSIAFDGEPVIKGLSYGIQDGAKVAIIGASGSGKTSLVRALLGLIQPIAGEIVGVPKYRGVVFQEDRLIEDWSAYKNVELVCDLESDVYAIVDQLTALGIEEPMHKRVREYSGGMRRRVALVRALINSPDLIILDEPFKGLDEQTRARAAEYVLQHKKSATLIIVTHDMDELKLLGVEDVIEIPQMPVKSNGGV